MAGQLSEILDDCDALVKQGAGVGGIPNKEFRVVIAAARLSLDHDRRVTELLTANNELLERARAAERRLKDADQVIAGAAGMLVAMGKYIGVDR